MESWIGTKKPIGASTLHASFPENCKRCHLRWSMTTRQTRYLLWSTVSILTWQLPSSVLPIYHPRTPWQQCGFSNGNRHHGEGEVKSRRNVQSYDIVVIYICMAYNHEIPESDKKAIDPFTVTMHWRHFHFLSTSTGMHFTNYCQVWVKWAINSPFNASF
jgi:hypothetical protein